MASGSIFNATSCFSFRIELGVMVGPTVSAPADVLLWLGMPNFGGRKVGVEGMMFHGEGGRKGCHGGWNFGRFKDAEEGRGQKKITFCMMCGTEILETLNDKNLILYQYQSRGEKRTKFDQCIIYT